MVELSIVEIREIVRIVGDKYEFDLSNYALTSLKYSLEKVISRNALLNPEGLFRRFSDDPDFVDNFLYQVSVPSTEMFRDPSLWRWLKEDIFGDSEKRLDNYKIWLPACVSGAELYSLCLILLERKLLDRVRIFATCFSNSAIEFINSGKYPLKKLEVSIENYKRLHGSEEFSNYYTINDGNVKRDPSLIKNVEFIHDDFNFKKAPKNVKLILFRNSLIYFNPSSQIKILESLYKAMSISGNLILGAQERIKDVNTSGFAFELINEDESVYKKKLN